jgi:two-component system nitrogen regulation response regulator GlnG
MPFDIVVTDCEMPFGDGLELIGKLKETHPGLPVIGMSGDMGNMKAMLDAGAKAFLLKPFPIGDLLFLIEELTRKAVTA